MLTVIEIRPKTGIGNLLVDKPRAYNRIKSKLYEKVTSQLINAHPIETDHFLGGSVLSQSSNETGKCHILTANSHPELAFTIDGIDLHRESHDIIESYLIGAHSASWAQMPSGHYPPHYLVSVDSQIQWFGE